MRKIIVSSFITLDGVMQAPGGPEEDKSSSFKYGGWSAPYFDEVVDKVLEEQQKNLQTFFWAEKHLRFLPLSGPNTQTFGQVSMI
jgi:hypothetical protein